MRPPPHIVLSGCNLGPKRENSKAQPGALFILILTGLGWCGDVVFGQCAACAMSSWTLPHRPSHQTGRLGLITGLRTGWTIFFVIIHFRRTQPFTAIKVSVSRGVVISDAAN